MLNIYKFFCYLNYPLWLLVLNVRRLKGKEHWTRYKEKLGICLPNPPKKNVIWVNALGLGETLSLAFFLQELAKKFENHTILFTSSTLQSQLALAKIPLRKNIIHQFSPVDNYYALNRFLKHWNPKIALFSELDIWPFRIMELKKRKKALLLFNSRMNNAKKKSRKMLGKIFSEPLKAFDHIYLQDEKSKAHFLELGAEEKKVKVSGPIKSAGTIFSDYSAIEKKIRSTMQNKIFWTAASVHESEENEILEAYKLAKRELPNLILIIVPRSIELSKTTVRKSMQYSGFVKYRYRKNDMPNENTEIFVVGRVGELGLWYKLSFVSFIGNSLNYEQIKTGKNPFEALQARSVVIHGPKMLEPGYKKLSKLGVTDIVNNRFDIFQALVKYSVPSIREPKIIAGTKLINENNKIVHNLVTDIYFIAKKKGTFYLISLIKFFSLFLR